MAEDDFSRVFLHLNHHEYNPNVPMPPEAFVRLFHIPRGMNVGLFIHPFPLTDALCVLQRHNNNNRNMVEDRTYGMTKAMENGTFTEGSPDAIRFDWYGEAISGQKRIKARVNAGDALHPKYDGVIWLCVQYGLPPTLRAIDDKIQGRKDSDSFKFLPEKTANEKLLNTIKLAYTIYSGRTSSTLVCNLDDHKRVYGAAQEAFRWAAKLTMPAGKLQTASIRLALAEMHMQSPEKADQTADALYHSCAKYGLLMQPIRALLDYNDQAIKYKRAPLGAICGGTQSVLVYKIVVPFLDAVLYDRHVEPQAPPDKIIARGWTNREIADRFKKAIAGRVPNIGLITDPAKLIAAESKMSLYAKATQSAQRHGVIAAATTFAAFNMLNPQATPEEAQQLIEKETVIWNSIARHSRSTYERQPENQRFLSPSVLSAFLYQFKDELTEVLLFINKNMPRIMAGIIRIVPRGKSQKASSEDVLAYLTTAFKPLLKP